MTVGGVDTYYDYDERQWKFRRLGGGPVHQPSAAPLGQPLSTAENDGSPAREVSPESADG